MVLKYFTWSILLVYNECNTAPFAFKTKDVNWYPGCMHFFRVCLQGSRGTSESEAEQLLVRYHVAVHEQQKDYVPVDGC